MHWKHKGKISEQDTDELQYVKMIIKETRLHTLAPMIIPRETMSHFKIQDSDIDPKTLVFSWKDSEKFIPERFDGSSIDYKGQNFEFLLFGAGRRICPGMYMGITTLQPGLANLLYWFDWKLLNGMKEEDIDMEENKVIRAKEKVVHKPNYIKE
ncbi:hypothetical protein PRUPE_1G170800 [Prunus persica]|uniref:Cytochrome P450 n=1 Tax=Prunus persica TaxID=3760 RepID=M5Y9L1_PRUPE|nr:hypothetical protein PRUPE_1G170800 [Prunus persica]